MNYLTFLGEFFFTTSNGWNLSIIEMALVVVTLLVMGFIIGMAVEKVVKKDKARRDVATRPFNLSEVIELKLCFVQGMIMEKHSGNPEILISLTDYLQEVVSSLKKHHHGEIRDDKSETPLGFLVYAIEADIELFQSQLATIPMPEEVRAPRDTTMDFLSDQEIIESRKTSREDSINRPMGLLTNFALQNSRKEEVLPEPTEDSPEFKPL